MTYEERVEQAIAANDIATLHKYAYGYPCRCTTIKGEPMCVCAMQAKALREKIIPRALFDGEIQRVDATSAPAPAPSGTLGTIFGFLKR